MIVGCNKVCLKKVVSKCVYNAWYIHVYYLHDIVHRPVINNVSIKRVSTAQGIYKDNAVGVGDLSKKYKLQNILLENKVNTE